MPYEKIHAYEKGCVLFRLDYADLNYCPKCSRYVVVDNGIGEKTQTKIPVTVLRYMPIVPRLQRLSMVEETARQMTWHKTGKRTELDADGILMIVHTRTSPPSVAGQYGDTVGPFFVDSGTQQGTR